MVSMTTAAEAMRAGCERSRNAGDQQHDAEGEPDRRIGVLLGVAGGAAAAPAPWKSVRTSSVR